MKHTYIDKHSDIDSYIHRLDPRIKIISLVGFILFVVCTQPSSYLAFALYALLIAVLILFSKIPLGFIFKRSLAIVPFVLMIALFIPFVHRDGLAIFRNILIKSYLCILSMILLMSGTKLPDLLKALERMKVPSLFVLILSFMYRYIFVVQDELMKMYQAKKTRSVGGSKWLHTRALANMLGVLFMRTYERGEKVYLAMCSRGFNGRIKTLDAFQIRPRDISFLMLMLGILSGIAIMGN